MTETEKLKAQIQELQMKLQKLEEKSPAEEAFKRIYYRYPDKLDDEYGSAWDIFEKGYEAHQSLVDDANKIIAAASMTNCIIEGNPPNGCSAWSEWFELFGSNGILHNLRISAKEYQPTPREPEENMWKTVALLFGRKLPVILPYSYDELSPDAWYRWVVFTYDKYMENPDESVEDYLKPHTPEQTEKLLREAFQKVQQTEEWKETQRKIDGKNPPEFLKFELGQNLTDLIYDWWEDVFAKNSNDDMENCIGRLVYWIEEWLPKEQTANSQNVDVEFLVEGFNDAIKKIKGKLR